MGKVVASHHFTRVSNMMGLTLIAITLASCVTATGTFCDIAKPHRFTEQTIAAMSDQEVAEALAHNRKGEKLCGWRA